MSEVHHPLKAYRIRNNVSLKVLADLAGTSRQSIFRIEQGVQTPSLSLIERITEATDGKITANDFVRPKVKDTAA